jgi:DNA-binding MarR family transcriptional regulator
MATAPHPQSNPSSNFPPNAAKARAPESGSATDPREAFQRFHIGILFQRLSRNFERRVRATLRERGHTGLQPSHQAVFVGLGASGTRLTDLANRAQMTKQAMGQLVDDLERLGYVERVPDLRDGRAKIVRLTETGDSFLQDTAEVFTDIWREYASLLGERELVKLQSHLDSLLEQVRQEENA